jgi:hypothetical protein
MVSNPVIKHGHDQYFNLFNDDVINSDYRRECPDALFVFVYVYNKILTLLGKIMDAHALLIGSTNSAGG